MEMLDEYSVSQKEGRLDQMWISAQLEQYKKRNLTHKMDFGIVNE